ncbi:MAG: CoA transferase [Alphaproteobacteria bacterium]
MSLPLPLDGLTVIELGDTAAAPFCGMILADLGADVIKVERPGTGDAARGWGPGEWYGISPPFLAINRNKRSIIVDIKDAQQLARLKDLVRNADVFFHNLRPGTAGNFGLDGKSLLKLNPRLIHCTVGAFGRQGPLSRRPGYDPLMQAFGGIMSVTGEQGRPPVRVGVPVVDFGTAHWCAIGILAAINRRHATGKGSIVDASLYETALSWSTILSAVYGATGIVPQRMGSGIPITTPYRAFETADGHLIIACANDRLFVKLCEVLGRPEWATDPRFSVNQARLDHRDLLEGMIQDIVAKAPRATWEERLTAAGIPNAPIQDLAELHTNPQTQALGILQQVPEYPDMQLMGLPLSFDDARPPIRRRPPGYGEHTDEVFAALDKKPRT